MRNLFQLALAVFLLIITSSICCGAGVRNLPFAKDYRTPDFSLFFTPRYPLVVGEYARINIKTKKPAERVEVYMYSYETFVLKLKQGVWTHAFEVCDERYGWQPLYVYIWYPGQIDPVIQQIRYRSFKPGQQSEKEFVQKPVYFPPKPGGTSEGFAYEFSEQAPLPLPEIAATATSESSTLKISGSQVISFSKKSVEGTREGYAPGTTQERVLKIHIAGKSDDTEIDANFLSTSSSITSTATAEQVVSVRLKHGPTEAYFGDFTADISEVEFTKLNKRLSGVQLSGEYDRWGFKAIASTPQGQSKLTRIYGNNTQGPYALGYSPVVINSDQIFVNDLPQVRGQDYDIDYNAGTITFKNRILSDKDIIKLYFDYRQTLYSHATYALRTHGKVTPEISMGLTYLNDSDGLAEAQNIYATSSIEPESHYVVGVDGSFSPGEWLTLAGEGAFSEKNLNLLLPGHLQTGKAGKVSLASRLGPVNLTARYKKVGAGFEPIGEGSPKLNLQEYGGTVDYLPEFPFLINLYADNEKYTQDQVAYAFERQGLKTKIFPALWPALEYQIKDELQSNDPVTGVSNDKLITKNDLLITHKLGFLQASLQGYQQRELSQVPSAETLTIQRSSFGLSTTGLEKITASGNVQYEKQVDEIGSASTNRTKKIYNANLSLNPIQALLFTAGINYTDDSTVGVTNVTDLSYKLEPNPAIKTDGSLTINAVDESFGDQLERVTKQVGSFKLELSPIQALRLRYYFKPNFTLVNRTGSLSYNNETQQIEFNLLPTSRTFLGVSLKKTNGFTADKTDYPTYSRKQNTSDSTSTIYSFKAAPSRFLSTELNYIVDEGLGTTLLATPEVYEKNNTLNREFNATVKTPLSETFAVDTSYACRVSQAGTGETVASQTDTLTQTGSLKLTWNMTPALTVNGACAYSQITNQLLATDRDTYTVAPSVGFIYRYLEKFRLDGTYTYSKSYAGSTAEKMNYSLKGKYTLAQYINISLQADQEISFAPDYKTTDVSGYVEIVL